MALMALRFAKYGKEYGDEKVFAWFGFANDLDDKDRRISRKKRWNRWYRSLAILTGTCGLIFLICGFTHWLIWLQQHIRIFLLLVESIAVFSFGVAWFLNGRAMLALPFHRKKVLSRTGSTNTVAAGHGQAVRQAIAAGMSAKKVAENLNITRQRVSEIAAEIT